MNDVGSIKNDRQRQPAAVKADKAVEAYIVIKVLNLVLKLFTRNVMIKFNIKISELEHFEHVNATVPFDANEAVQTFKAIQTVNATMFYC